MRKLALLLFVLCPSVAFGQGSQYGFLPPYSTASLPTCDTEHQNRVVFDTTLHQMVYCTGSAWATTAGGGGSSVPAGSILLIVSGSCPSGFSEETTLNGKTLVGTLLANANVGSTGGADSVTPAGTVSQPTFTGSALGTHSHGVGTFANGAITAGTPAGSLTWPVSVPTFAGSALATHSHELPFQIVSGTSIRALPAATFGTGTSRAAVGGWTATANTTAAVVAKDQPLSAGTPAGTIAWPASVPTFAGSALGTHNHTITGSSSSDSAGTPAGTVSQPTFTGASQENRSAFTRVIFCRKT